MAHGSTSVPKVTAPRPIDWLLPTAGAGLIGSTLGSSLAFFITIMHRDEWLAHLMRAAPNQATVFWYGVGLDVVYGGVVGLAIGLAFALTWFPLVEMTVRHRRAWFWFVIPGFVVGNLLAWGLITLLGASWGRSLLLSGLAGLAGGVVAGVAQAAVLWKQRAAHWRWVLVHGVAFGGAFAVLTLARDAVGSILVLPFVWLSLWGLYGVGLGYGFDHIHYHYANEQE